MTFPWISRGDNFVNWELWHSVTWRYDNCNLCYKIVSTFLSEYLQLLFCNAALNALVHHPACSDSGHCPRPGAGPCLWRFPGAHSCSLSLSLSAIPFLSNTSSILSLVSSASLLRLCSILLIEALDSIGLNMGPWRTPQILSQNFICIFKKLAIPQSQWTYTFEVLLTLMFGGFAD